MMSSHESRYRVEITISVDCLRDGTLSALVSLDLKVFRDRGGMKPMVIGKKRYFMHV